MKRILFLCITLLVLQNYTQAQCVPNAVTGTGKWYLIPDSATGLKHACPGNPYSETIYIKALKDTTLSLGITATIDSFVIDMTPAATGLPSYINVASVPTLSNNKVVIKGDSLACIKLTGNVPANATPASLPLNFTIKAYAKLFGVIDTSITVPYTSYSFNIDTLGTSNCWPLTLPENDILKMHLTASPNPTSIGFVKFNFDAIQQDDYQFELNNSVGEKIITKKIKAIAGKNIFELNVSNLPKGIYFYTLSKNTIFVTQRLVIQ